MSRVNQPLSPQSLRYERLLKVFQKATDMSLNSVGDADLAACFGPTKSQFGNALQKVFVNNMVVKTQNNATASFQDLCIRYDLEDKLSVLERTDPSTIAKASQPTTNKESTESALSQLTEEDFKETPNMTQILLQIKSAEKQELLAAIAHLEADMKRMTELASRLRAQVNNELTAASEERQKIVIAANNCARQSNEL